MAKDLNRYFSKDKTTGQQEYEKKFNIINHQKMQIEPPVTYTLHM